MPADCRRRSRRPADPPAWLVVGAVVDYCSIIGGSPTAFGLVVRAGPELMGGHSWVVWLAGKSGCVACEACIPARSRFENEGANVD
jgi:hypothetical protein